MASPAPPTVIQYDVSGTRVRDAMMMVFRISLLVWAVTRIHACRAEDWWVSVMRAFGWAIVKDIVLGLINSALMGVLILANANAKDPVTSLLKWAKALSWVIAVLTIAAEVAFMTWASSC